MTTETTTQPPVTGAQALIDKIYAAMADITKRATVNKRRLSMPELKKLSDLQKAIKHLQGTIDPNGNRDLLVVLKSK